METFRTSKCSRLGHPELTIRVDRNRRLIPDMTDDVIAYFESEVARGTKFLPGQTIKFGWSILRICQRPDDTLGLEEMELTPHISWTESVTRALKDNWFQVQVASSVGLSDEMVFPRPDESALVQPCARDGQEMIVHRLPAAQCPDGFSGWSVACRADHVHEETAVIPLRAVAAIQPGLVQFLALPHETAVLVRWRPKDDQLLMEPHILRGRNELAPKPGSYLDKLRSF